MLALISIVFALDLSISNRKREILEKLESRPTTTLGTTLDDGDYAVWSGVNSVHDLTSAFDRIMLCRKLEVSHTDYMLTSENGQTAVPVSRLTTISVGLFANDCDTKWLVASPSNKLPFLDMALDPIIAR